MIGYKKSISEKQFTNLQNRLHKVSNKFRIMFGKIKLLRLTPGNYNVL